MSAAVVLGFLLAKLLSPVLIVLGLLAGWFARVWWQVIVAALGAAMFDEAVLYGLQQTRSFIPETFIIAVIAAAIWGFAVFAIRQMRRAG